LAAISLLEPDDECGEFDERHEIGDGLPYLVATRKVFGEAFGDVARLVKSATRRRLNVRFRSDGRRPSRRFRDRVETAEVLGRTEQAGLHAAAGDADRAHG
jgi:hypothetical protein